MKLKSNLPFGKHQSYSHSTDSTVKAFVKPVPYILKKNGEKYHTKFTMVFTLRSV